MKTWSPNGVSAQRQEHNRRTATHCSFPFHVSKGPPHNTQRLETTLNQPELSIFSICMHTTWPHFHEAAVYYTLIQLLSYFNGTQNNGRCVGWGWQRVFQGSMEAHGKVLRNSSGHLNTKNSTRFGPITLLPEPQKYMRGPWEPNIFSPFPQHWMNTNALRFSFNFK